MLKKMLDILGLLIKRRTLWRLGRLLYLNARNDIPNDMETNGEALILRQFFTGNSGNEERLIFFDVGANIGNWTCLVLGESERHFHAKGFEIHAFEPLNSTFKTLKNRIDKHPFRDFVHLVPQALSSEEGKAVLFITGENVGTNSFYLDSMNYCTDQILINRTTIDAYCSSNNIDYIHYLKIDAEGHDMEVLNGARELFQNQKVLMCQFEYNHRWIYSRHFIKDVFDFVDSTPYSMGKITPDGIDIYEKWHPELEKYFEGNYVLIHSSALRLFSIQTGDFDIHNTYCPRKARITDISSELIRGSR